MNRRQFLRSFKQVVREEAQAAFLVEEWPPGEFSIGWFWFVAPVIFLLMVIGTGCQGFGVWATAQDQKAWPVNCPPYKRSIDGGSMERYGADCSKAQEDAQIERKKIH